MQVTKSEYFWFAVLLFVLALGFLGWVVSPLDPEGRPIILLPDVKRVEDYREKVGTWTSDLRLLDGRLTTLLAGNGDLLSQSREGQQTFEDSLQIAKEADAEEVPAALAGLRSMVVDTSLAYLEASRSVLLWISAPKQKNYEAAIALIQAARGRLAELEGSSWITR